MKIRTCLLAAFGLVVPLLAMFSHLIPAGVSDRLWNIALQPAVAFFDDERTAAEETANPSATDDDRSERSTNLPLTADTPIGLLPTDTAVTATPLAGAAPGIRPTGPFAMTGGLDAPDAETGVVLPTVTIASDADAPAAAERAAWPTATVRRPPGEVDSPGRAAEAEEAFSGVRPAALQRPATGPDNADPAAVTALAELGAFGIVCQPTAGGRYYHCSCRVAADPTGQLVRMFHATEADPKRAMLRLVDDVRRWQDEVSAQTAELSAGGPPAGPGETR